MEKLLIFKLGGKVLEKEDELDRFLTGFAQLPHKKILVHGGGVVADQLARELGIPIEMHEGRRVTSEAMRDLVTMVYGGLLNKKIVGKLQALGCDAIGLSGADARILQGERRSPHPIDYGFVGDIQSVREEFLEILFQRSMVPVLAPLSWAADAQILNSNADSVACKVTEAFARRYEASLLYCFDKAGVLMDLEKAESVIPTLDRTGYERLKKDGLVSHGMLPKLDSCFRAKTLGAHQVFLGRPLDSLAYSENRDFQATLIG